jgi:predicted outer membrane repeat protein
VRIISPFIVLVLGRVAVADTWVVDTGAGDFESIQAAIDMASDGDQIEVAAGTYTGSIDFGGKAIQVIGMAGAADTILMASPMSIESHFIHFETDESHTSLLTGFTVSGAGRACISIARSSPTLMGLIVTACGDHATVGTATTDSGGVRVIDGSPSLDNVQFVDNRAEEGAGLQIEGVGLVTLTDCSFSDGIATDGGAIHVTGGDLIVSRVSFDNNQASFGYGGAIRATGTAVFIDESTLDGNVATYDGGAIAQTDGSLEATALALSTNSADHGSGGAMYVSNASIDAMSGVEMVGNTAGASGGGLYIAGDDMLITIGSLVATGNAAAMSGGAVQLDGGSYFIEDALLQDNSADTEGGALSLRGPGDVQIASSTISGNDAGTSGGGLALGSEATPLDSVYLSDAALSDNAATDHGGGARIQATELHIEDTRFVGNATAGGSGGGLWWVGDTAMIQSGDWMGNTAWVAGGLHLTVATELSLLTSVVQENTAGSAGGGAVITGSGNALIQNNDFLSNEAGVSTDVGNLAITGPSANVVNNIIAWASAGSGVSLDGGSVLTSSVRYNDLWDNAGGDYAGELDDLTDTDGNIAADPWLLALTLNGDFDDDDLHLNHGSPCTSAGDPSIISEDDRPSDIGAYPLTSGPLIDEDGDTYPAGVDCDDADSAVHPGAEEVCNGIDDDCDGVVDAGCPEDTGEIVDTGEAPDTGDTGIENGDGDSGGPPDEPTTSDSGTTNHPDRGPGSAQQGSIEDIARLLPQGCRCSSRGAGAHGWAPWLVAALVFGYRRRGRTCPEASGS